MSVKNINRSLADENVQRFLKRSADRAGFSLGMLDRLGIGRLLRQGTTRYAPNLDLHRAAAEKAPVLVRRRGDGSRDLARGGCHVTYVFGGDRTRSGLISMNVTPRPGHVLVASLLGATLIGMQALQEVPLMRDGAADITSVVVLEVFPPLDRKGS